VLAWIFPSFGSPDGAALGWSLVAMPGFEEMG
jgi:hypothetical protein